MIPTASSLPPQHLRTTSRGLACALLLAGAAASQEGAPVLREGARDTPVEREGGWHYEWDARRQEWRRTYAGYEEPAAADPAPAPAAREADARGIVWNDDGWDVAAGAPAEPERVVAGTIESFGRMRAADGTYYLLRLRADDGGTRIVDLGTRVRPTDFALRRGEHVRFRGAFGATAGTDVLRATAFARERGAADERTAAGRATFTGRLAGLRESPTSGAGGTSLVVLLERDDGSTRVADLGPSARLRGLGLRRGDELTVVGEDRERDGKRVLHAYQLRAGDAALTLRSTEDLLREATGDARWRSVHGALLQAERTRLAGHPATHLVMRLELADGSSEIVDFGSGVQPSDLPLAPGASVHVRGPLEVRAGVSLLRAEELSVNGDPVDVGRAAEGDERR